MFFKIKLPLIKINNLLKHKVLIINLEYLFIIKFNHNVIYIFRNLYSL